MPTRYFTLPEAINDMIVEHPGCLHVGVADGRAHKLKAALFQVLTQRVRLNTGHRIVPQSLQLMHDRSSANESPNISIEALKSFLNLKEALRVVDGGEDFLLIADDAGSLEQQL